MRRSAAGILLGLALALGLGAGAAAPALAADGPDDITVTVPAADGDTTITNAQLRWGLNAESGGGAFYGGCNFLSAGKAGDSGSARVWTSSDGLYRASSGKVRIEKPNAAGRWEAASFATRCLDAAGKAVTSASTASTTGNQVVIDGGSGVLRDGAGLQIQWKGSFTVAYYGGMTYWSVSDPVLTLDEDGNGRLVGTLSGFGTSMDDLTMWKPLPTRSVVLAEVRKADLGAGKGFSVVPQYVGVKASGAGQVAKTSANAAYWGSFPQSFVDYHELTGQQGYWLTTGGIRDAAKPATALYISYDAKAAVTVPVGSTGSASGASPSNPLRLPAAVAEAANVPTFPVVAAVSTQPQRAGLVPEATGGGAVSPLVAPLLGSALSLLVGIVAVLNMMQVLPWQGAAALRR